MSLLPENFNQNGFISQLLIVLLLISAISAGTYLVSQRTNLLPKADEEKIFSCLISDINKKNQACSTTQIKKFSHCDVAGEDPSIHYTNYESCLGKVDGEKQVSFYCKFDPPQCPAAPAAVSKTNPCDGNTCKANEVCGYDDHATRFFCLDRNRNICAQGGRLFHLATNGGSWENSECSACTKEGDLYSCDKPTAVPPAAPAAGTAPEVPSKTCTEKCPSNSLGCFEIDGKPRCVFSSQDSVSCTTGETQWCQNPPDPRKGCEVGNAVIVKDQTKTPVKFTRCTAEKAAGAAPAAPAAPATAKAPNPALSSGAQTANTTTPAGATSADCGYDYKGTRIPCYKIGVFDDKTASEIEKNAKIASENYKIYAKVLEELEREMDTAARNKAKEALTQAQTAAACIK